VKNKVKMKDVGLKKEDNPTLLFWIAGHHKHYNLDTAIRLKYGKSKTLEAEWGDITGPAVFLLLTEGKKGQKNLIKWGKIWIDGEIDENNPLKTVTRDDKQVQVLNGTSGRASTNEGYAGLNFARDVVVKIKDDIPLFVEGAEVEDLPKGDTVALWIQQTKPKGEWSQGLFGKYWNLLKNPDAVKMGRMDAEVFMEKDPTFKLKPEKEKK